MKPLLRAVLIVDAGLYLSSGAVLLLTPLAGLQRALQLTTIEPAMVGQMLGLALLALAWLSLRGAVDGAMTVGVAKIVGHVTWLAGALVLAWAVGPHTLWLPALGIVPNLLIGGFLVVIGLGGARFAQAVRRREIAKAAQGQGGGAKARSAVASPAATSAPSQPVEPVLRPSEPRGAAEIGAAPYRARSEPPVQAPVSAAGVKPADEPSGTARTGAASGSGDVRAGQPASAPRPPFHG
jgi:hypothetical protein